MTRRGFIGMAKATHFGPTVLVVTISFVLSITQLCFSKSVLIALAILCGQCVVGWTNELIDQPLDTAAGRTKKPLVAGDIRSTNLQVGVATALISAVLLSFLGPLGIKGGLLHMLGIGSATAYNFGLKKTWLSPFPYVISFGAMPWAIYAAAHKNPPLWLYIDFALVSMAFHFLNVIKDLEWDREQGVMGMPQRVGKWGSIFIALMFVASSAIYLSIR